MCNTSGWTSLRANVVVRRFAADYQLQPSAPFLFFPVPNPKPAQAYESFGGLQAVTDHPTMWVGLGLLKEKEACQPGVTPAKRRRLLSQVGQVLLLPFLP